MRFLIGNGGDRKSDAIKRNNVTVDRINVRCRGGRAWGRPGNRLCGFFFAGAVGYLWRLAGQRGPELGVEIGQGMTAPELYDSRWKLFAAGQPAF